MPPKKKSSPKKSARKARAARPVVLIGPRDPAVARELAGDVLYALSKLHVEVGLAHRVGSVEGYRLLAAHLVARDAIMVLAGSEEGDVVGRRSRVERMALVRTGVALVSARTMVDSFEKEMRRFPEKRAELAEECILHLPQFGLPETIRACAASVDAIADAIAPTRGTRGRPTESNRRLANVLLTWRDGSVSKREATQLADEIRKLVGRHEAHAE